MREPFICPYCVRDRAHFIERDGHDWKCTWCGGRWFALSKKDRDYLRCERIAVDEPEADAD